MTETREVHEHPKCYHCGDICDPEIIRIEEKTFCCEGCRTVYELLDDNDLCTYYDLEQSPGVKMKKNLGNKFAYLENEEVIDSLVEFSDGKLTKVRFYIPQMHCSSCIWLLENLYRMRLGIIESRVNFVKKEAYVTYEHDEVSLRTLVELMASIGYEPAINLQSGTKEAKKAVDRSLYYKLGIAGFAFGNIMLLSFPEYLDVQDFLQAEFKRLFGYLNLALALPVFFYSASEYFISAFKGLRAKYVNIDVPVSLGIIVLFLRSAFEIISETGPGFMDSFSMFVFLLLVGKWYQNKTYGALSFDRDYKSYFPIAITKLVDGAEVATALSALDVNDIILVRNGEIVPADSTLLSNEAKIDYSFVTGESDPVSKKSADAIYAGGRQTGGVIKLRVDKPVSQSYLTRLWNKEAFSRDKTAMNRLIDKVSRNFTFAVLFLAIASLGYWLTVGVTEAVYVFTAVLIIACPCALALTVPFTFGNVMRIFGKHGFYLKNTDSIERLAKVDTLVFDKTGTLTTGKADAVSYAGHELSLNELKAIKAVVKQSSHPISAALYKYLTGTVSAVRRFNEVTGEGVEAETEEGFIRIGSHAWAGALPLDEKEMRSSIAHVTINGTYKGYFMLRKDYRPGLEEVLKELGSKYELYLLSGDNAAEFDRLRPLFQSDEHLKFNQKPDDKLAFIRTLREHGKNVLMVGDGLNDAGALQEADVGISIADDIFKFSPACDAILKALRFDELTKIIDFSRKSMQIVKASFLISITYNTIGMIFALQGLVTPLFAAILMPLSSVTVVTFVTVASNFKARRMGFKAPETERNEMFV